MKVLVWKIGLVIAVVCVGCGIVGGWLLGSIKGEGPHKWDDLKRIETIELGDGVKLELILVLPGSYMMGSEEETGEEDEMPQHQVTISQPFYLGKYEVTQEQWETVMGYNPSKFKGKKNPVDTVSWKACQQFLNQLQNLTGEKYALPTEAQWEYACRAGSEKRWCFGEDELKLSTYAWFDENAQGMTHPVGQKASNAWGVYDMYGNVQEWCEDWYQNPYSSKKLEDPQGADKGDARILRGGAWGDSAGNVRSAYRNCSGVESKTDGIGFRCIMQVPKTK